MSEPKEIPNVDRWGTSQGPKHYPYVRFIGGVSLFDFHKFDPQSYQSKYPISSWRAFVPYREVWGGAVCIEIDRKRASPCVLSGCDLLTKYKSGGDLGHNIAPNSRIQPPVNVNVLVPTTIPIVVAKSTTGIAFLPPRDIQSMTSINAVWATMRNG